MRSSFSLRLMWRKSAVAQRETCGALPASRKTTGSGPRTGDDPPGAKVKTPPGNRPDGAFLRTMVRRHICHQHQPGSIVTHSRRRLVVGAPYGICVSVLPAPPEIRCMRPAWQSVSVTAGGGFVALLVRRCHAVYTKKQKLVCDCLGVGGAHRGGGVEGVPPTPWPVSHGATADRCGAGAVCRDPVAGLGVPVRGCRGLAQRSPHGGLG